MKNKARRGVEDPASLSRVRPLTRRRRWLNIGAIYLATVVCCALLDPPSGGHGAGWLFDNGEQYVHGARLSVYWRRHADLAKWLREQIVLVPLSDDTFDKEWGAGFEGPPVPRRYHAKVVRELEQAGVRAIVFDLIFDQPSPDDAVFTRALQESHNIILGSLMLEGEGEPTFLAPSKPLRRAAHLAHILSPQGAQQMAVERVLAVEKTPAGPLPALSFRAALEASGLGRAPLRRTHEGWDTGSFTLPVNENGDFFITFWGKPSGARTDGFFPSVPYEQIHQGALSDPFYKQNNFFKNKIALIGDVTKLGNDYRFTPAGHMTGLEIQAHATATVLAAILKQQPLIYEAPRWVNFLMIALLAALACRFAASWRLHTATLALLGLVIGWTLLNFWFFTDYGILLHFIAPCVAAPLATLGILTERSLTEERQKNFMRGLLGRYVSPQVAEFLAADPNNLQLGGQSVTATVLFSDVRGFTRLSRQLPAAQIVALLNEYLQAMTDIVFAHEGTLDKYIGDGLMAVFGTPAPQTDHARRAVAAALEMRGALEDLHQKWRAQGLPELEIGIGIATGEMIAGNMGARQRLDFTVIGPTVNLASRLESLNKELGTRLLIHETTFNHLKDEISARGPLSSAVHGHDEEELVYEVLGWKDAPL